MFSDIFTKPLTFQGNIKEFERLYQKSAVRIAACADLLLPSRGELVPRFIHNLDTSKLLLLWRFRCRPMRRALHYTQDVKKWMDGIESDMAAQRDEERQCEGKHGLIVDTCATASMVKKMGTKFNSVNKSQIQPHVLLHGATDENMTNGLFSAPDESLKQAWRFSFNSKLTVGVDFRDSPILRANLYSTYNGGCIRDLGQGANRFTRPTRDGAAQCTDPVIYSYIPGLTVEDHQKNRQKRNTAPKVLSLQTVAGKMQGSRRIQRTKAAKAFGTSVPENTMQLPCWYTETAPIFELEAQKKDSKDWHFLAAAEWAHHKRYPMIRLEKEENFDDIRPSLYPEDALINECISRRDASSSHLYDVSRFLSLVDRYVCMVCSLANADLPADYGIDPLTEEEQADLDQHYGAFFRVTPPLC